MRVCPNHPDKQAPRWAWPLALAAVATVTAVTAPNTADAMPPRVRHRHVRRVAPLPKYTVVAARKLCALSCAGPSRWTGKWRRSRDGGAICDCKIPPHRLMQPRAQRRPAVRVVTRNAGRIRSLRKARRRCPKVCRGLSWSGSWTPSTRRRTATCRCLRPLRRQRPLPQPPRHIHRGPVHAPAPMPAVRPVPRAVPIGHDGCRVVGQQCVCGNTGRSGRCGPGPHKIGLYCRCD